MNFFMPPRMPRVGGGMGMQQFQLPGQLTQRPMPHPQPMGGMEGGGYQLPQFGGYGGGQMPNRMPLGQLGGGYSQPQPGGGGMGVPLSGLRQYKDGTDYVPETGPAILHRGEAVIPSFYGKTLAEIQKDRENDIYARDQGMNSFKYGTSYVPHTGPALVHRGEMVIPAKKAAKMRKIPLSAMLKVK